MTTLALVTGMSVAGPVAASAAGLSDLVCPAPGASNADRFSDDDGTTHEATINCAAQYGLVGGFADGTFRPNEPITRGQMATFLVNWIEKAHDRPLVADGNDRFRDDDTSVHEANIEKLVDNGLVSGLTATAFGPNLPVTRAQVATFVANALRHVSTLAASSTDAFRDDDSSVHEDNINALAAAGVIGGTSSTTYSPNASNTRGQQATQGMQAAGYAEQRNDWAPTKSLELTLASTSATPGGNVSGEATGVGVNGLSVSGCGVSSTSLGDRDASAGGIQFQFQIPQSQALGDCTLQFTVAVSGSTAQQLTRTITVVAAPAGGGGTTSNGLTSRPEVTSVQFVATSGTGTTYRVTFDEPVTGAPTVPGGFKVYTPAGASTAANSAVVETAQNTVLVGFSGLTTPAQVQGLALFAVANNSVFGNNAADGNTEAHRALNSSTGSTSAPAGITTAPDLISVSGIAQDGATTNTLATFTFDENAWVVSATGFRLVKTDGTLVSCTATGGAAAPATAGATSIPTSCTTAAPLTSSQVARGVIDQGTVSDANESTDATPNATPFLGTVNVVQATNSPDAASDGPDLSTVSFAGKGPGVQDEVLYTFADPLFSTGIGAGSRFFVYDFNGNMTFADAAPAPERNPSNNTQVLARFPDGALDQAVGAGVLSNAVTSAVGANLQNQIDEVGVANTIPGTTAGRTNAPDLMAVELLDSAGFGSVQTVVFRFDETVTGLGGVGSFVLYQANGTRFTASGAGCAIGTAANSGTASVRCPATAFGASPQALSETVRGAVTDGAASDADGGSPIGAYGTTKIPV